MSRERWKDVVGYEGYYKVSNLGRVKSLTRKIYLVRKGKTIEQVRKGKLNTLRKDKLDYMRVKLSKGGITKLKLAHRLVCEAFHGPAPVGKNCVNHINSNRSDNNKKNLIWCSHAENMKHAGVYGKVLKGGSNPHAKRVRNCRGEVFESITEAAKAYNMKSMTGITGVLSGLTKTSGKYLDGVKITWEEVKR